MKRALRALCFVVLSFIGFISSERALAQDTPQEEQAEAWTSWGGDARNTHNASQEHWLTPQNVGTLKPKWIYTTRGDVSATPTVEGDAVYVVDWGGYVYRINATNGKTVWIRKVSDYTGNSASFSRTSPAIGPDRIVIGDQGGAVEIAINKANGNLLWKTIVDPLPAAFITNSPVIVGGHVYIGVSSDEEGIAANNKNYVLKFRGSIQSLNLQTGAIEWKTYVVPTGYTGGAVWGSNFVIDLKRNALYAGIGNNYSVPASVTSCLGTATTVAQQLACLSPEDYIDGMLALNLTNGSVKWSHRFQGSDTWTVSCIDHPSNGIPCPDHPGPDYDFGAGTNLMTVTINGKSTDILGAGQKSGYYWAVNPDNGSFLWGTKVGPGGLTGGVEWGTATDNKRIYVPITNYYNTTFKLQPTGVSWNGGAWSALDPATGKILWQTKATGQNPLNTALPARALAPISTANGVVFGGSMSGDFVAMDAATGKILWKYNSGGSVNCAPSIVDATVYWGSGYTNDKAGTGNKKLFAFQIPAKNPNDE